MDALAAFGYGANALNGLMSWSNQRSANKTNLTIARENNQAMLDAMREQNEFNRKQAIDMFNMENEYNSPTNAIRRMLAAGMNPYAGSAAGQQIAGGMVGDAATPQGAALPAFQQAHMETLPSFLSGGLEGVGIMAKALSDLSQAGKTGTETDILKQNVRWISEKYKEDAVGARLMNDAQRISNHYAPKEKLAALRALDQSFAYMGVQIDNAKKEGRVLDVERLVKSATEKYWTRVRHNIDFKELLENYALGLQERSVEVQESVAPSQIRANEGSAAAGFAAGELSHEEAITERSLRQSVVTMQDALAKMTAADWRVRRATIEQEVTNAVEHAKQIGKITEHEYEAFMEQLEYAKNENNYYGWNHSVGPIINGLGLGLGAFAAVRGMKRPNQIGFNAPAPKPSLRKKIGF